MKTWEDEIENQEARRRVQKYKSSSYKVAVDAAMDPRVRFVIAHIARLSNSLAWALGGDIALGVYTQPRYTDQVEVLVEDMRVFHGQLHKQGFQRRSHAILLHRETQVLIEVRQATHQEALNTAIQQENRIRVLGVSWLIFTLLPYTARTDSTGLKAKADILQLLELYPSTPLQDLPINSRERKLLAGIWPLYQSE